MLYKRDLTRDIETVRSISAKLDKRISREKIPQDKIDRLSVEELLDLNKITGLANFMLCKYEDKKATKEILEGLVPIIDDACSSVDGIDDEIAELLAAAEDSIHRIRCAHTAISETSEVKQDPGARQDGIKTGANNLTNIVTEINPLEYLSSTKQDGTQVI